MATAARNRQNNGAPVKVEVSPEQLAEAAGYEQAIAAEADAIWTESDSDTLTRPLLRKLLPLLRRPIPEGFISEVSSGKGKPYASKGIKSMQVQIDRLDNVLSPVHWGWATAYQENGQLAEVVAWIGDEERPLVRRRACGGINRLDYGQTVGNLYKGSETNAGKLALARLGPGHEVYVGLTDLDPDVSEEAFEAQAQHGETETVAASPLVDDEQAANLLAAVGKAGLTDHLAMKLRGFGAEKINELTVAQGLELWTWAQNGGESA